MTMTVVDAGPRKVSRSAVIQAPAADLFAIVADPHRHSELDGSGTVMSTVRGPEHLAVGDRFSVRMKQYGVPYRITSRVTELEDGRLIEWRHPLGHRWRWEFAPQPDGSTLVTETFDYSTVAIVQGKALELLGLVKQNGVGIEATLTKLQSKYAK